MEGLPANIGRTAGNQERDCNIGETADHIGRTAGYLQTGLKPPILGGGVMISPKFFKVRAYKPQFFKSWGI